MAAQPQPDEELYQIAILIDELKHSDVNCRLKSMRKLPVIGAVAACARPHKPARTPNHNTRAPPQRPRSGPSARASN